MSYPYPFAEQLLLDAAENTIKQALAKKIDAVEVSIGQSLGFSLTVRNKEIETLEHHRNKSLTVTVYKNHKTGTASSSDLSNESIQFCVEKACAIVNYTEKDPCFGLADPDFLAKDYPNLSLYHPWSITPAEAIQIGIECEEIGLSQDRRIKQSEGVTVHTGNGFHVYANSLQFLGYYPGSEHSISCSLVAEENSQMERDYEYTVARRPEYLMDVAYLAKKAAEKSVQRLNARKLPTQKCPVIFHSGIAKSLIRAFVQAIQGSNIYRQSSFLHDALNQRVFPSKIEIYQEPHLLEGLGSAPFDAEGVRTWDCHYIHEGVLVNYVLGSYSARKLGLKSTGNSGGVYNLKISNDNVSLDRMIKQMGKGLLVTELLGQGVNILTGDYSRAAVGFWVEHGEIQYPVHEITIAGNLRDIFAGIVAVGNDVDARGSIQTGSIWVNRMMIAGE